MPKRIVACSRPDLWSEQHLLKIINEGFSLSEMRLALKPGNYVYAASPSYTDIMAAYTIALPGDTIIVPAGAAAWPQVLSLTKPVRMIAAGVDSTIITVASGARSFTYHPPAGTVIPFRMSGFRFNCNNVSHGFTLENNASWPPIRNVRVDHNAFYNTVGNGVATFEIDGPVYGVADHNLIEGGGHCDNMGQNSCADWAAYDFAIGTANNWYWEDNDIHLGTNCAVCTGGHGGQYVYRYNQITYNGSVGMYSCFDMHGNQSGVVGPHGGEIYENVVHSIGSNRTGRTFYHRGGIMVIFNNQWDFTTNEWLTVEENCNSIPCSTPYPYQVQQSYYWSNHNNTHLLLPSDISGEFYLPGGNNPSCPIAEGVNWWFHRVGFDGTVGMGVGTLAQRPSSGLVVGVGWWATDERKLYRATSPTTWELYYTPYTYPHPLRSL